MHLCAKCDCKDTEYFLYTQHFAHFFLIFLCICQLLFGLYDYIDNYTLFIA